MRLCERYLAAAMLKASAMTLLILVILLVFFTTIEELDDVGTGDYRAIDAFLVSLLSAPRYVFDAFPVAALLGSLVGLGALAAHGELVAMRSAGFSLAQMVAAVLKTGLAMVVVVVVFGEFVAPRAEALAQQHRVEKQQQQVTMTSRYGFWARDGDAVVNIRLVESGAILADIHVYEFGPDRKLTRKVQAERAEYAGDHWEMVGVSRFDIDQTGITVSREARVRWDSMLDPALLGALMVDPSVLRVDELWRSIRLLRDSGQATVEYEVALWNKITTPLSVLVMLLLALPFVLAHRRFAGAGQRVFLGVLMGMAFYTLSRGMSYASVVYDVSPLLTAVLPTLAFLAAGVYMLGRFARAG
jgi:lipopolysaccharide export system permease protein